MYLRNNENMQVFKLDLVFIEDLAVTCNHLFYNHIDVY